MKPRLLPSFLIFLSAYAPLSVIVAAKDFDYEKHVFAHQRGCMIGLGIATGSVLLLLIIMRMYHGQHPVTVNSVKGRAGDLINYSIPYLVTFVTVDKFFELPNLVAFSLFMLLMFILTYKTQSLFINPILAVLSYGLYDVEFSDGSHERDGVFLVRGEFSAQSQVRIIQLSQFLYLGTTIKKGEQNDTKQLEGSSGKTQED
jgi:hypothetical protein